METQTTQTTKPIDKKVWENPTLVMINQNNVNGGPVNAIQEGTSSAFVSAGNPLGYTPANNNS
jgi:hypothetical protein